MANGLKLMWCNWRPGLRDTRDHAMKALKDIPDFVLLARRSFEKAIGGATPSRRGWSRADPDRASLSADQRLVAAIIDGCPLRLAARSANLSRADAKEALARCAIRCAARHASFLGAFRADAWVHAGAWDFSPKDHSGRPTPIDQGDDSSIWTHLWRSGTRGPINFWMIGPPSFVSLHAHAASIIELAPNVMAHYQIRDASQRAAMHDVLGRWLSTVDGGLWNKIRLHWLVLTLLVAAHNFCVLGDDDTTLAMQAGWAPAPWRPEDLASRG
jgi:hypothetical protein